MEIPDISIPEIYVPDVPEIYSPHYITITKPPEIDVPGCTYQHRDIKNTGNRNLLLEDPNGVFTTCDFPFPSFIPLDYTPENLVGKQVIGVCNFPTKNIAGVVSEVLVLGAIEKDGTVVLVHPSQKTDNGLDIA